MLPLFAFVIGAGAQFLAELPPKKPEFYITPTKMVRKVRPLAKKRKDRVVYHFADDR